MKTGIGGVAVLSQSASYVALLSPVAYGATKWVTAVYGPLRLYSGFVVFWPIFATKPYGIEAILSWSFSDERA